MLLPHLQERGVDAHVFTPPGPAVDYFETVAGDVTVGHHRSFPLVMTVVGASGSRYHLLRNAVGKRRTQEFVRLLHYLRPDIVHLNEWGLFPLAKFARAFGVRVVAHARTMPHPGYPRLNRFLIRRVGESCDHLFCISGSVARAMQAVTHQSVLYNPVEKIEAIPVRPNSRTVNFLSLSAIQETKGVHDIVDAAELLRARKDIQIDIAGRLSSITVRERTVKQRLLSAVGLLDFEYAERFRRNVEARRLSNVRLLGHVEDVDAAVSSADVILAPMHLDAPPRSVYEGAIHQRPSILAMQNRVEDIVEHESTGLLIGERKPSELAAAIARLADEPDFRKKMGAEARRRCLQRHDPRVQASKLATCYEEILCNTSLNAAA